MAKSIKKKRDYRAEYRRRIERGIAKGLSLSQARGHPKTNEKPVGKRRPIEDELLQIKRKSLVQSVSSEVDGRSSKHCRVRC